MIRTEVDLRHLKDGALVQVCPLNDIHWNTEECDKPRFQRYIQWGCKRLEAGERIIAIGLGDYNDALSPSERASFTSAKGGYGLHETTLRMLDDKAREQSEIFAGVMKPWKGHIAGLLDGHHFMCFSNVAKKPWKGSSNTEYLCHLLDTTYLGQLGFIDLRFPEGLRLRICASHGYGGARTIGARAIKRVRMNEVVEADLYLMGHDNTKMAISDNILVYSSSGQYVSRKRTYCGTGSFQRAYPDNEPQGGYVEQLLLPPSDLGAVITTIRLEKRDKKFRLDWHTSV